MSPETKTYESCSGVRFVFKPLKHFLGFLKHDQFKNVFIQMNDNKFRDIDSLHEKDKTEEILLNDELRKRRREYGWKKSGWLVIIGIFLHVVAVFLPYVMAVKRKAVDPFLPFISQGTGAPPESGIFVVIIALSCLANLPFFVLLFVNINQRISRGATIMRTANKFSLSVGLVLLLGWIIVAAYPCGYTDLLNKYEWALLVLFEHMIGAAMFISGSALFIWVLAGLSWFLPDESKKIVLTRTTLGFVTIAFTGLGLRSLLALAEEEGIFEDLDILKTKTYELPTKFSENYITTAFCEWTLCVITWVFLFTFYGQMQKVSVSVVLHPKVHAHAEENETTLEKPSKTVRSLTVPIRKVNIPKKVDDTRRRLKLYVSSIFLFLKKPSVIMMIAFCLISHIASYQWSFFHECAYKHYSTF